MYAHFRVLMNALQSPGVKMALSAHSRPSVYPVELSKTCKNSPLLFICISSGKTASARTFRTKIFSLENHEILQVTAIAVAVVVAGAARVAGVARVVWSIGACLNPINCVYIRTYTGLRHTFPSWL
jgi:hypothetical protein